MASEGDVSEKKGIPIGSKPLKNELISGSSLVLSPIKLTWKNHFSSFLGQSIKCTKLSIHYKPYLPDVGGTIVINLYDKRFDNPQKKLRLHTAFPAKNDQYIDMKPNAAFGPKEVKDPLCFEIFGIGIDTVHKTNYAWVTAKSTFVSDKDKKKGGIPDMSSSPALKFFRGDVLTAKQVEILTRRQGFLGPPISDGNSYVLEGISNNCVLMTTDEVKSSNPGDIGNSFRMTNLDHKQQIPVL
ncbi:TPA_asm: P3 [Gleditsia betacytorhabdovirus 1]|nr:TPA_asm: P3 [Gleditsia betacytorhabdovirus 1]